MDAQPWASSSSVAGSSSASSINPAIHASRPATHIYRTVRNLAGVTGYITCENAEPPVPNNHESFGEVIDSYIEMEGFDASSVRQLSEAYSRAPTIDAFVHALCSEGMPQLQVEWIWNHIV